MPHGTVIVKIVSDTNCRTKVIAKFCTDTNATTEEIFILEDSLTFEINYQSSCYFRSDEPVMMMMYLSMSDAVKDPTMTTLPAIETYEDSYRFYTPPTKRNSSALEVLLVLVVKDGNKNSLMLSGTPLSGSLTFDVVVNTDFVVGVTRLTIGYHTITANGDFLALIIGIDDGESYSFPLGMDLKDPDETLPLSTSIPGCSSLPVTSSSSETPSSLTTSNNVAPMTDDPTTKPSEITTESTLPTTVVSGPTTNPSGLTTKNTRPTTAVPGPTTNPPESTTKIIEPTTVVPEHTSALPKFNMTSSTSSVTSISTETTILPPSNITCPRSCVVCTAALTNTNGRGWNANILELMVVNRKTTSRYLRTLTSAQDDRLSVVITGSVGGAILVGLFLGIVALDIDNLVIMIKLFRGKVTVRQTRRSSNKRKEMYKTTWC
ncbi:uncharacterized protein LOC117341492 [Pecten maximus]|uniref:uncharacterized protein LOC117341492 n=1 Tax=Pecten maximus TaxID=6579 RepID=UPI0014586D6D|nr:uncharacterized protein LOC117341492 [Pecten maximus]